MIYADDTGVVSKSPKLPRKIMGVIVVVCAAFGRIGGQDWDHVFTREGDTGVHGYIQRRGSGPGVQPDKRVCIPLGGRQPQCRPVHRGLPAHTQRIMMQLPEVHP